MPAEYWIIAIDPPIVIRCEPDAQAPAGSSATEAGDDDGDDGDGREGESVVTLHQRSVATDRSDASRKAASG